MGVTIRINNNGLEAKSIIRLMKNLAEDYDFIEIFDDGEKSSLSTIDELKERLSISLAHPYEGITWEEMEKSWKDEDKK